jgi:hypothetical protein
MKKLLLGALVIILFACNKSNDKEQQGAFMNYDFEFTIYNAENQDLLNPSTPGHFDISEIRVLYKVGDEITEVHRPNLDYPNGFKTWEYEDENYIRVFMNDLDKADSITTYIQWSENDTDTINAQMIRISTNARKEIVWFNGEEIWNINSNLLSHYRIQK